MARQGDESLSERLESSQAGRFVISSLIAVILICLVVGNLPGSALKDRLSPGLRPLTIGAGLEQDWGVFSPDPRMASLFLSANLHLADGSVEVWRPPSRAGVWGAYRAARWQKYVEYARADDRRDVLWQPLVEFVARQYAGRRPLRVELVRTFQDLGPPGADEEGPWTAFTYYTWDVPQ